MRDVPSLVRAAACTAALLASLRPVAAELPRVASINLCTDQLVLAIAAPEQIATLSWLAADPEESMLAAAAAGYPLNFGTAEELLRHRPDVVVAGNFTAAATVELLERLEYRVVTIEPAASIEDIARNLLQVGDAIDQSDIAQHLAAEMEARAAAQRVDTKSIGAVVVRPGGFTIGAGTLADAMLGYAGLDNVAARQGLDRWGSLSIETLLRSRPEIVVITAYRRDEGSLANAFFAHPALRELTGGVPVVTVPARYWACGLPESLDSIDMLRNALERE